MFGPFRIPSVHAARFVRIGVLVAASLLSGLAIAADLIGTVFRGNQPAPGVAIMLDNMKAVSDGHGRFVIRNLQPREYSLKCGSAAPIRVTIRDGLNEVRCQAQ